MADETPRDIPAETPTQLIHRVTNYLDDDWSAPGPDQRVVRGFETQDRAHWPQLYKHYGPELARLALPRELRPAPASALDVLAGTAEVAPAPVDLDGLARLLFLASGITRTSVYQGDPMTYRAAGSAGSRFPLELYVAVPEPDSTSGTAAAGPADGMTHVAANEVRAAATGRPVPPGVHWYDPADHALVAVGPPPTGDAPTVVVTGVPWRTGWRYRERGFRHVYWDAGTMLSQLLAVADSGGLDARLHLSFPDRQVAGLVGADGIDEFPVAVVALGDGPAAISASGPASPGHHDADGRVFPLVTAAQHAGDQARLGPELTRGAPVRLLTGPATSTPGYSRPEGPTTVDEVVLRRGSIRRLDPDRSIPRPVLVDTMAVAMRGIDVPHWVAVSAVDGVAPGVYRWPDLDQAVRHVDESALRVELHVAALKQGLAKDAAYVAISAVDLFTIDDHGYRRAQLEAGLVEGRLHLVAGALGAAATGMTFIDPLVPALLGEDRAGGMGDRLACLLWTCVGMGEYRSGRAGTPGSPSAVHIVEPR